jgi:hypothetical protein
MDEVGGRQSIGLFVTTIRTDVRSLQAMEDTLLTDHIVNNRATVDWCLFGRFAEENNTHVTTTYPYQQCNSKCRPIFTSVDYDIKRNTGGYDYCNHNGTNFTSDSEQCISCLYAASELTILGNSKLDLARETMYTS